MFNQTAYAPFRRIIQQEVVIDIYIRRLWSSIIIRVTSSILKTCTWCTISELHETSFFFLEILIFEVMVLLIRQTSMSNSKSFIS